jgi:DNA polymerase III alpha subunit (gram-positive type)
MENLMRFDFDQEYIIVDTEAEGLNLVSQRPFQLSFSIARGKKIIENHDYLIKISDLNMSADAARITKFDRKEFERNAKPPIEVWRIFRKYLYDPRYIIVGQNIFGFDNYMFKNLAKLAGCSFNDWSFINRVMDTKLMELQIVSGSKKVSREDLLSWQLPYVNYYKRGLKTNLKYLMDKYGVEYEESKLHEAVYDNNKTFEVFWKQLWELEV